MTNKPELRRLALAATNKSWSLVDNANFQNAANPQVVLSLLDEVERLNDAIDWTLGIGHDFRPREEGEGAFWWRKELPLYQNVQEGSMEVVGFDEKGEPQFRLTPKGEAEALAMMKRAGLSKGDAKNMSASEFLNAVCGEQK